MRAGRPRLSQHFLHDRRTAARIAGSLRAPAGARVLEIGPGEGALTRRLIEAAGRIAAVEIDRDLAASLRGRFATDRLVLHEEDVLELDLAGIAPGLGFPAGTPLVIAGNLAADLTYGAADPRIRLD